MSTTISHKALLGELAGQMTGMHMEALETLGGSGLTWQDLVFANMLALRALATLQAGEETGQNDLRAIVASVFDQTVIARRFEDEDQAHDWMLQEGLIAPEGPTH